MVRLRVDPALEQRYGPRVRAALSEAARAWDMGGQVPRVELDYTSTSADRSRALAERGNWVGLAESWSFGDKLAVTVSTFDTVTGALIAAQVWINPNRKFELTPEISAKRSDTYDFQAVLTHEFGHVLGLGEAAGEPDATMFPTFRRGETRQRTLSPLDRSAVGELYAATAPRRASPERGTSVPGPARALPWPLLMLATAGLLVRPRSPALQ